MSEHALLTFLLNSLWQVPLVAAIAWLLSNLLRHGPSAYRHSLWMVALLAAVLLPATSIGFREHRPSPSSLIPVPSTLTADSTAGNTVAVNRPAASSASLKRPVAVASVTATTLLGLYLLFTLAQFIRLGMALGRTVHIRHASEPVEPSASLAQARSRALAGLGVQQAELRTSRHISGPVMLGGCWNTVILPHSLLNETSEDLLVTAVGHEIAHLKRHDFSLHLLCEFLALPIAFHPATLLIKRGLEHTRELACDELVTRHLIDPARYARSLVTLAHDMIGLPRPACALGVFDGNILEERIRRVLHLPVANFRRARLLLAAGLSALAVCVIAASGLAISARAQSAAFPEMKLAEAAFNSGDHQGAVDHFRNAVNLDPANINAKLFLANALGYIPSSGANAALQIYDEVLTLDPTNQIAIFGLARYGGPDRWQSTHGRLLRLIVAEPNNVDAYYTIAVMDWQSAWKPIQQAFTSLGAVPTSRLPDDTVRRNLRNQYQPVIDEGLRMLQTAVHLDANRPDSLAYMNLLYREASFLAETPAEYAELVAKADEFVVRALAVQRLRQKPLTGTPGQINVDGPPPVSVALQAPPPPPPPPPGAPPRPAGEPKRP